jgi:hypothetical protein
MMDFEQYYASMVTEFIWSLVGESAIACGQSKGADRLMVPP